jgi:hypothetical protein
LRANGIECDSRIAEMSEEHLKEILEQVGKLRKNKKKKRAAAKAGTRAGRGKQKQSRRNFCD